MSEITTAHSQDPDGARRSRRIVVTLVLAAVFALFGTVVWLAYQDGVGAEGEPPIIRADPGPIKVRPEPSAAEDAGPPASTVYQVLDDEPPPPRTERLLPRVEEPLAPLPTPAEEAAGQPEPQMLAAPEPRPAAEASEPRAAEPAPEPDPVVVPPARAAAPERETRVAAVRTEPPVPAPRPRAESPVALAAPAPDAAPERPPAPAAAAFRLQLVAVRDDQAARRAWEMLRARHASVLGQLQPTFETVETDSGILHRLQAGPFPSRAAAEAACAEIKRQGGDCFVVAPRS